MSELETMLLKALKEADFRIEDLCSGMDCVCIECPECGKMPKECTGTECAQTCQCSECDLCMAEVSLEIIRAAIAKAEPA